MAMYWQEAILASHSPELLKLWGGGCMVSGVEDGATDSLKPPSAEQLCLRPLVGPDLRSGSVDGRDDSSCSSLRGVLAEGVRVFFFWKRRR